MPTISIHHHNQFIKQKSIHIIKLTSLT